MTKSANTQYPILPAISERWSPRSFSKQMPEKETLMRLFEAARWAASSGNRQPWFFIVATKDNPELYEKLFSTLRPKNQLFADSAPVLVMAVMYTLRNGDKYNLWAPYDLGQAVSNLATQATAEGLFVHQMAGFDREMATNLFHLPEGYEPMTVMTIGYLGEPEALEGDFYEREVAPRERRDFAEFVFNGDWGKVF